MHNAHDRTDTLSLLEKNRGRWTGTCRTGGWTGRNLQDRWNTTGIQLRKIVMPEAVFTLFVDKCLKTWSWKFKGNKALEV